jgi:hypothetical protein
MTALGIAFKADSGCAGSARKDERILAERSHFEKNSERIRKIQ